MSHGAGLVRTTCSSGGGPGAGAGQPGARPSEGPLDPIYPRTYSALLKVAQMVAFVAAKRTHSDPADDSEVRERRRMQTSEKGLLDTCLLK